MSTYVKPRLSRNLVLTVLFNTLIGLLLTGNGHNFWLWSTQLYAQAIGLSIFGLATAGSRLFPRHWQRPKWPLLVFMPISVVLGYLLGVLISDAVLGHNFLGQQWAHPRQLLIMLVFSLGVGTVLTTYFRSREQVMQARADTETAQRQAAEARLRLLESQLEPHMLFNTLANLRALIETDAARALSMLDSLNAFLRATLSGSRTAMHPLAAEFERLRDYLELIAVRMGPRLQFTLALPEALREVAVPPLLLQSLVENSIRHGLEPKVEGGRIAISARQDGAEIVLEVLDTGIGMDDWPGGDGFGLAQVRERLATAYGGRATLVLHKGAHQGTILQIHLPAPRATP